PGSPARRASCSSAGPAWSTPTWAPRTSTRSSPTAGSAPATSGCSSTRARSSTSAAAGTRCACAASSSTPPRSSAGWPPTPTWRRPRSWACPTRTGRCARSASSSRRRDARPRGRIWWAGAARSSRGSRCRRRCTSSTPCPRRRAPTAPRSRPRSCAGGHSGRSRGV
ncbi:MAG: Long-chain-fatty-acid--CoA ligase, partial [uncultured Actinomycetospora sp.]